MKIGVLTSSRADFGIYLPLLRKFQNDNIHFEIIVFGTHLSKFHGYTLDQIKAEGFNVHHCIESMVLGDSAESISSAIGITGIKFSSFWAQNVNNFDVVLCLGDRYEMFAAVFSGVPFNIKFAHIHGGEVTLGAIDNTFRHSITLAAELHFTSTENHAFKVRQLIGSSLNVFNVGALSLDNIKSLQLLDRDQFLEKWHIDLNNDVILVTFHPETIDVHLNLFYTKELISAIIELNNYQIVVTMPNADTTGNAIRVELETGLRKLPNVALIENFGTQSYFTIMNSCKMLIGNTSSGVIEAASFGKYVINLGNRQLGRECSGNVFNTPINKEEILNKVQIIEGLEPYNGGNVYWNGGATNSICKELYNYVEKRF